MSHTEIKATLDELKQTFHQFAEADKRHEDEIKTIGTATQETKTLLDTINNKLDELEKKGEETVKKMERARILTASAAELKDLPAAHVDYKNSLFGGLRAEALGKELHPDQKKWLHDRGLWSPEMKALSNDNDTQAGYLVTPEYIREIIKGVVEFSPVRELARVRQTTSRSVMVPVRKGTYSAKWTSERGTRTETTGLSYGLEEIPTHEMYADIRVTRQDLEDSAFNMESEMQNEASEQFGVAEGSSFISGSGVGQPEGLLTNSGIEVINSGVAADISPDSLISLFFALKDAYARKASWLLRRSSLKKIRQMKDTTNQYLWQPGIAGTATPATILDRPYREAIDMPDVVANATPILFGDFNRGYTIVDRLQITIQRVNEKWADQGQIGFYVWKRIGGQVTLPEAIKKLKCST